MSEQKRTPSDQVECAEFHIAGLGASAGGLEALEAFFASMPTDSGIAFIVVQHLSPDFKSRMHELLARRTSLPIHRVENGMEVEPNSIYLIPPKMEMAISERKLLLTEKTPNRSLSHPIDLFFRSLAHDAGRYAIGIVFSGTGSDGSRGIREINEAGGLIVVQDEESAKFDGMPMNAQATGVADLVLPPAAIAEALVKYVRDGMSAEQIAEHELLATSSDGVSRICELLHQQHGLDFSHYKSSTVSRRIQRRVELLQLASFNEYLVHVESDLAELNQLYKDLLIGVTQFFRDAEAFESLEKNVIPQLFSRADQLQPIRVWVAGCATGEEAYSIAMLLDEERNRRKSSMEIKVFATDVHHVSLHTAARAVYSEDSVASISQERLARYFQEKRDGYYAMPDLRRMIIFAPHNVINDAPFTQMNLVMCRNLLIYLQPTAQKKVLSLLHFALKAGEFLFLGPSETTAELKDEFEEIDAHWRIYKKMRDVRLPLQTPTRVGLRPDGLMQKMVTTSSAQPTHIETSLIGTYDRLLDRRMPPSILVDRDHQILHIFGGAERFMAIRGGRPSNSLLDSIDEHLKTPLMGALQHAVRKQDMVRYTGIQIPVADGYENVRLMIEPIHDPRTHATNLLIEIEAVGLAAEPTESDETEVNVNEMSQERIATLESELRFSQENLQATIEEMETANEELQATNEELTASNEELQSTNEELHSVNEELYTVNAEHQRRVDELTEANNDMDNLLATTRVGVIFLDDELFIRRFTPEVGRLFHLVPQDVGRSIEGFVHHFRYDSLMSNLKEVFQLQREKEIHVEGQDNKKFLIRMLPYRSGDKVQGVVLTLIDITTLAAAQAGRERFEYMAESAGDIFFLIDRDASIRYANPAAQQALQYDHDEFLKMSVADIDPHYSRDRVAEVFARTEFEKVPTFESELTRKDGSVFPVEISASHFSFGQQDLLFISVRDVARRKEVEAELRLQHMAIESAQSGIVITDPSQDDNPITYANPSFAFLTGFSVDEVVGKNCRMLQGPETDPAAVAKVRQAVLAGQSCKVRLLNYRRDGSTFWNELHVTPVHDEAGRLTNFLGIQNDVSGEQEAEEQLLLANQLAKEANASKSEFLANMSHELRTPMTAVLGFAEMLEHDLESEDQLEKLRTIKRNGEYLLALLNDILDLSKIEAGKMEIGQDEVSVHEVVEGVRQLMDVRAAQEGIPLYFEWQSDVPKLVTADRIRTRQILVNLIGNALKFTDEGEVRVSIEMAEQDGKRLLSFRVRDTGIGIEASHLNDLFEPFNQATRETSARFGGTGLGLSISRRLANAMGGTISVESELGIGSYFTFSLPVTSAQANSLAQPAQQGSAKNLEEDQEREVRISGRILLADDRRDVWRVAKFFLEKTGVTVEVVEDGQQALDAANRAKDHGEPFDLILMDMQMPVMNGREAVAELRKQGFQLPIVALTADAMAGERDACIEIGCDDYLPKPIDGENLVALAKRLIEDGRRKGANPDR